MNSRPGDVSRRTAMALPPSQDPEPDGSDPDYKQPGVSGQAPPLDRTLSQPLPETPAGRLRRLVRLQVYYGFFATLHWILLYFFLIDELGLPLEFVLVLAMFFYTVAGLVMIVLPRMEYRWAMRTGFLMRILAIAPFWLWPTVEGVLLGGLFFGLAQPLFWVPYNLMFFEHRARTVNAGTSAIAFAVQPVLDVIAAVTSGLLVIYYGYPGLFAAAFVLGLVGFPGTFRLHPRSPVKVDIWVRLSRLKRLRTLMLLDGVSQGIIWIGVALVTLTFLDEAMDYAVFFAIMGIMGAFASLLLGRISDKRSKRFGFIWPVALVFALANIVSAFATTLLVWGITRGLTTFFGLIFDPFKNAAYLDVVDTVEDLYMGRELLLNVGRVGGAVILLLFSLVGQLQAALLVAGAIAVSVPVLITVGNLYPDERFVLKPWRMAWRQ